ncbi:MAG: hypothetical protein AAF804_11330 [Bacteroidota bacterium]
MRIPPLSLNFKRREQVPAPNQVQLTLERITGLSLSFAAARIDKAAFEQAAAASPLDLRWGLGKDDYFDRIAINHAEFAGTIRLSLTPARLSVRLDVPVFRDYLWWATLKALVVEGAQLPQGAQDLPAWTALTWEDPTLPPAVKRLRELHEQKFNLVARLNENPAYKSLPEAEFEELMKLKEEELEEAFVDKYGPY